MWAVTGMASPEVTWAVAMPGWRCVPPAGGGAGVPVLPLVCLCLGLLWLRHQPVAAAVVAAFPPGLAVLPAPARPTRGG